MTIPFQNLRSAIPGAQPAQLDPGQVAFNVSDATMYLGTGADTKIDFSGAVVTPNPPAGKGWVQVLLNRVALNDFFVQNPEAAGRPAPTNEQVLTYNATLGVAEWQDAGTGFAYATTNTAVAAAPGATTSQKITSAIGSPVYIGSNATAIVVGDPGETYEGLYIYNGTIWVFAAHYAFNTATQVPATNPTTLAASTTQAVLNALKLVDDGIQTQVTGNSLNIGVLQGQMATAQTDITGLQASKLDKASNIPTPNQILSYDGVGQLWINDSQGDVTGVSGTAPITVNNTDPQTPVVGISAASTTAAGAVQLSNATNSVSELLASTPLATKTAYDLADAAVPRSTYAAAGDIVVGTGAGTFGPLGIGSSGQVLTVVAGNPAWTDDAPGDVTSVTGTAPITVDNTDPEVPIVGVELATTATPGVVQVELTGNLTLVGGIINVPDASTTVKGAVSLNNTLGSTSTTEALTAAQGNALQSQIDALLLSNSVTLAGGYNATTGLVNGVTSQGIAAGFAEGATPPPPAAGNADYYLICTTAGNIPSAMDNGDWLLSDGSQYVVLGVGARPASASYTVAGIVQLADAAAVLAGTSDTTAITPQALQDNVIDSVTTANSSQIASATAAKTANDNAVAANTAAGNAQTTANNALPKAGGTMTGTITAQNVNVQGTYSLQFAGGVQGSLNAVTDLVNVTSSTTAASATAVKAANDAAVAAQTTANAALPRTGGTMTGNITFQDAGEGVVFSGGSSIIAISDATGNTNNDVAASSTAVKNAYALADAAIPKATFTTAGQLLYGTGAGTYNVLPIGTNGQSLIVSAGAIAWGASLQGYTCTATPFNTALGANAGDSVTTGVNNTALGYKAGTAITGGGNNTFVGFDAGDGITSSDNNVAVGSRALSNTGGNNNTAVGYCTGGGLTSGGNNTFIGGIAGYRATTLDNAVAVGYGAMGGATSGTGQVAVGSNALSSLTSGAGNVAVGYQTLDLITTGAKNTAIGHQAGTNVGTNVSGNTLIGNGAGCAITTGANNTLLGNYTGTTTLTNNIVLSDGAGTIRFQANASGAWSPDGTNFGTVGQVLASNGTVAAPTWCTLSLACVPCSAFTGSGQLLTGTGTSTFTALPTGTNGQILVVDTACTGGLKWLTSQGALFCGYTCTATPFNTALGSGAGDSITSGTNNVALGLNALTAVTTTSLNVAVGSGSMAAAAGAQNVSVGANALCSTVGSNSVAVGYLAGRAATSGSNNTFVGSSSGTGISGGGNNTTLGYNSLGASTTGAANTAIGFQAMAFGAGSTCNIAIGFEAGRLLAGANNTLVGCCAGSIITTGSCNVIVGGYTGTATLARNVVLADGVGAIRFQANSSGAWSYDGTNFGTAGQVLKSAGTAAAPAWSSALYGAFSDSTTQTNTGGASGNPVDLNTTASANGFSIVSGTQITATTAGVYNIQFSLQFEKTDAGTDAVEVWFKKNGTDIANSNTSIQLDGNGAKQLFALNLVESLTAGQYLEVWWYSADANAQLTAVAAGTRPAIPSAIVTVVPVGA